MRVDNHVIFPVLDVAEFNAAINCNLFESASLIASPDIVTTLLIIQLPDVPFQQQPRFLASPVYVLMNAFYMVTVDAP